jgi:hypothetical protein
MSRRRVARATATSPHEVTVDQRDGAFYAECSCGESLGTNHGSREWARQASCEHHRKVMPHLCGPRVDRQLESARRSA